MKAIKIFLFSVLAVMVTTSCSQKSTDSASTADSLKIENVQTMILKQQNVSRIIDYTSSLLAFEEVHLAPASPGRIEKINVQVSDRVAKGQVLVQMDRTQLEQARINFLTLETDYKRVDTLKKTKSIAEQQYDQLKARYDIAKSNYDFLLENTQLKAPFSGIISGKYFENGEIYSGSPVASVGKPAVVSLIQIDNIKAQVSISSAYFPDVKNGMKAEVISDLYPGKVFKGEIYRIYPTIDNSTKTFIVEVKIQNYELKLRPGMFGKIRLNFGEGSVLLVPSVAVIKQTGTNNMYMFVNQDNKAVKKFVKTGRIIDDQTEILDGVKEGEEVVVVGQNKLKDKTLIKINN
jgi:RND family efflux transporter MFP subunit